jgi:hypothetical protein
MIISADIQSEKNAKARWADISESYPRRLDISSLHQWLRICKSHRTKQKLLGRTLHNSATDFFQVRIACIFTSSTDFN